MAIVIEPSPPVLEPIPRSASLPEKPKLSVGCSSIGQLALRSLRESGYYSLKHISCDCRKRVVTLHGRVSSFYMKQLAQTIAGKTDEDITIVNYIEVVDPPDRED